MADGQALLQELLRKPPAELATWALQQAQELSRPGVELESLPVFQVASALGHARPQDTESLIHNALTGVNELPPNQRAEAMRLAMQNANAIQSVVAAQQGQQGGPATNRGIPLMTAHHGPAGTSATGASTMGGASTTSAGSLGGPAAADATQTENLPPIVANAMRLAKEANFVKMDNFSARNLMQTTQRDVGQLMSPEKIVEVVQELRPDEREQLTEQILETRMVPEESRAFVKETLREGGYADSLARILSVLKWIRKEGLKLFILPIIEIVCAFVLSYYQCSIDISGWLNFDSILTAISMALLWYVESTLAPAFDELQTNPIAVIQRFKDFPPSAKPQDRLAAAVPGVPFESYQKAGLAMIATVVATVGSIAWTVIGVIEAIAATISQCSGLWVVFPFVIFRCLQVMLGFLIFMQVSRELQIILPEPERETPATTLLPMAEDAYPNEFGHPYYGP